MTETPDINKLLEPRTIEEAKEWQKQKDILLLQEYKRQHTYIRQHVSKSIVPTDQERAIDGCIATLTKGRMASDEEVSVAAKILIFGVFGMTPIGQYMYKSFMDAWIAGKKQGG